MCGIAGFADSTPSGRAGASSTSCIACARSSAIAGRTTKACHVEPGVGARHAAAEHHRPRPTGHQPIHNEDQHRLGRLQRRDLQLSRAARASSKPRGHRFYTSSDTETIVHAYEQWGEDAFRRLRGMFGIAHLGRPHAHAAARRATAPGIKPLHYADARRAAVLRHRDQVAAGAPAPSIASSTSDALDHYLSFLYTPRDASIFEGVRKLPPGHSDVARRPRRGRALLAAAGATRRSSGTEADAVERAASACCADAVRSHLVSDVPLGAFLSGGVDSSVGRRPDGASRRRAPVKTFSIGFDEPEFDELEHARRVAQHFGTDHHEFVVKPDGARDPRRPDRALRRAVRRLLGDSDVVRLGDGAPARHGGAVGRRRRRAVRRLRSLPAASARGAVRPHCRAGPARARPRSRGRCCRTARAARTSCATSRRTPAGRYLDSIALFQRRRAARAADAPTCGAASRAGAGSARSRATSSASPRCRATAR